MKYIFRLLLLCMLALAGSRALPVSAAAPYGWVTSNGRPVAWNNSQPISYSVDQGPLGRLSNADAVTLVQTAFQRWQSVNTASISFTPAAPLSQDITGANVLPFLNNLPAGVNPVIFDTDGSVMRTLLGDPAAAVAFGQPFTADLASGTITSGYIVLNGLYIDGRFNPDDLSLDDYRGMAVQEIGRFLGLGYSQLNTELILDGIAGNNNLVPQMYPQPVAGNSDQLTVDDRAAISALYPNPSVVTTGTIHGQVLLPDGTTGLQGINVIARRVGDPAITAVSAISGMRFKNEIGPAGLDGSRQTALRGAYELTGLPSGTYTLTFEALRPESHAGPLQNPAFLPGGAQYFRLGGAATTDPTAASQIAVSAGQVLENVNLVVAAPAGLPVQQINEREPNEFPEEAQALPLAARVHGSVQPGDASGVTVPLAGGAAAVQDLYQLTVTQPTIVSATLSAATPGADLNLFLLSGPVATAPQVVAVSADPGTPPETFQLRVPAGVYFFGVSLASSSGTAYTLDVNGTPAPDPTAPAPPKPRLSNLIVGNVTPTGADTGFGSDLPANTLLYVTNPLTEFSSPTLVTDHRQALTGLAQGTSYRLRSEAVTAAQGSGTLPDTFFTTALPALSGGVGQISAGVVDIIDDPNDPNAEFEVISFRNVGTGDSSGVALTTLNAPAGWAFTTPLPIPLNLGFLGRGGAGLLMTRIQRAAATAGVTSRSAHIAAHFAPIITGAGTYFSAGVGQQTFTFGGVVASLNLTKSASPSTARPGDAVTFTLTAVNGGMGAATGVLLSDALPAGMSFISAAGGGQFQNGAVFWNAGTMAPGASVTVSFQAQVAAGTANGATITNVALIRSNENPNPIASNVVPVSVTVPPPSPPQLQLSKSADRSTARPGDVINYTLTYLNIGPSSASNVLLTDTLPPGTVLVSAPGGVVTPAAGATSITWALGSLPAGASSSRSLQLQVAPSTAGGTTITNTGQITATEAPTPVTATAPPVQVTVLPQLTLAKSADRSSARPGDVITYTLTLSNSGSGPATNVQLSDPVPTGTSFVDAFNGVLQGGTVVWNLGTLGSGGSTSVSFRAQVQAGVGSGAPINNTAQVVSTEIQTPVPSNPVSVSIIAPPAPPQFQLVKSADRSTVQPGQAIRYSITVSNVGSGQGTNVQIFDAVPAGTTYIPNSADTGGGPVDPNTIGWTLSSLASGASTTVSFQVQAAASSGSISNVAQVRSAEAPTLVPSNQGNPVVVTVAAAPQLQIQKSVIGSSTVAPGDLITYQLSFSNAFGGGVATGVTLQDFLPANTSFVGASSGGGMAGITATWSLGTLQPGQNGSVTLQVRVNPGVPNGTPINNTAQITSAELQSPVSSNSVTVNVVATPPPPVLSVVKQEDVASAPPGGTVNYQITVSNNGAGPATNVTVSDPIPAGMTGVFALDGGVITPGSFGSPAVATWNVGTLGPGGARQVRLQVQVNSSASGAIANTARATSVEAPAPVSSNSVSVTVNIPPPPLNLAIQKAVDKASAAPGDTVSYTLSFQNNGGGSVSGAAITDTVPANTQVLTASQGASLSGGVLSWNLTTLNPGQGGTLAFQVRVNAGAPNQTPINNQAQITVAAQQYAQSSNTVTTTVVVPQPPVNLALQKAVDKASAAPGDTVSYTLSYQNNGAGAVSGAAITDTVPANTQVLTASQGASLAGGVLSWNNLPAIQPGQGGSVTFQVRVNPGTLSQTPINNQAQITVAAQQYTQSSNTVTTTVVVPPPPPSLTLSKAVDKSSAMAGDTLTYTLSYANTGTQAANPATIQDQLPAGLTWASGGQLVNGTPPNTGQFVRFSLGTLAPGASGNVQFTAKVNNGLAAGTQITNQATITAPGLAQPVISNAVTTTVVVPPPPLNLAIQKAVDKASAAPGDTVSYTLSFKNNGAGAASGAAITDTVPANTQVLAASQGASLTGGVLSWNLSTLNPGQGGSVAFQVRINAGTPDQTPINNQAQITVAAQQYAQSSNTVTTTVVVPVPPPSLTLSKAVDKSSAMAGDTLTYTLSYANTGTQAANAAVIQDQLPAGLTFGSAGNSGQLVNGTPPNTGQFVRFSLGTLAPGASGNVQFTAKVNNGLAAGTQITNQATITATGLAQPVISNAVTTTVVVPPPSLSLQEALLPPAPTAAPGDTLPYVITYQNNGTTTVNGAVITAAIPAHTQFVVGSQGATPVGGVLTWNLPAIPPGQAGSVAFRARVNPGTPDQTMITSQATLNAPGLPQPVVSNTVTTTVLVAPPPLNLAVQKSVDKASAAPGDTVSYVISFKNNGAGAVSGAAITDTVPAGTQFVDANPAISPAGGVLTWNLPSLAPGQTGSVSFRAQIDPAAQAGAKINNQAQIAVAAQQYSQASNTVSTTVGTSVTVSFAGTWFLTPASDNDAALTVDPQNRFTVWGVSKDRISLVRSAQGKLNPDGSFDVFSSDRLAHFTGKVAADRQSATINAVRTGVVSFTVVAPRAPDVGPLPTTFVGTFNGFGVAANGDRLHVLFSIDPGGNSTFEGDVVRSGSVAALFQVGNFYVTPDGRLTDPSSNRQVGMLQVQNNTLVLTYSFVTPSGYQNSFTVPLQPLP